MKDTPILLIAAVNKLGFIGNEDGDLICKCSRDLQRFKELSKNGVLIMGRKTYESLPKALPDRSVVVVSTQRELKHPVGTNTNQILKVGDLNNALEAAHRVAKLYDRDKIVIAGGTAIYHRFLLDAEYVYMTHFEDETFGEARFPVDSLDKMIADERLAQSNEFSFYDGEMRVTFKDYELTNCVELVNGDLVRLRNGSRFLLSQLQSYVRTEDSVMIALKGFGFHVTEQDMNLDRLLKELDDLVAHNYGYQVESINQEFDPIQLQAVGESA